MKKTWTRVKLAVVWGVTMLLSVLNSGLVFAAPNESGGSGSSEVETSVLPGNIGIGGILKIFLNVLVYGLGAAAVLGVVIVGIQYMTARDNEAQVKAAKQRLYNILLGLLAWAVMFAALNWLIPGGLNFDTSFDNL